MYHFLNHYRTNCNVYGMCAAWWSMMLFMHLVWVYTNKILVWVCKKQLWLFKSPIESVTGTNQNWTIDEGKVSCSIKQWEPLMRFKLVPGMYLPIIVVTPVWRSPISMPFLFISRNAMCTLQWRHCMLSCL